MYQPLHFSISKMLSPGLILFILFSFMGCTNSKSMNSGKKVITSRINVTYTSDYCGGAPPPEELLQRLKTPKKFSNQTLYIFDNKQRLGNATLLKTNTEGQFDFEAEQGMYYVYLKDKMKFDPEESKNKNCKEWLLRPYAEFEVIETEEESSIQIHKQCNPCLPPRM